MASHPLSFTRLPRRPSATDKPDIREQLANLAIPIENWVTSSRGKLHKEPTLSSLKYLVTNLEDATSNAAKSQSQRDYESRNQALSESRIPVSQMWEDETRTWALLGDLLPLQSPFSDTKTTHPGFHGADRAGSEPIEGNDFVARFVNSNPEAKIMCVLLRWLEHNADQKYKPVEAPFRSHGHMIKTREAIKQVKVTTMTTGPLTLETNPALQQQLGITSHLDPDAMTRQNMKLVDADMEEEHRVWKQLFIFLRCGTDLKDIYEYCKERDEVWRYLSFGLGTEHQLSRYRHLELPNAKLRLSIWRESALATGCDQYRAACYAILSGSPDLRPCLERVSQGWEDILYAQVNSWLLQELAGFVLFDQEKRKNTPPRPWATILSEIMGQDMVKAGMSLSVPRIQVSLINRTFLPLAREMGYQLAREWKRKRSSELSPFVDQLSVSVPAHVASLARDPDAVRLTAHLLCVYYLSLGDAEALVSEDPAFNVIIQYINTLIEAGLFEKIPTYLKIFPMTDRMRVLGFVLLNIETVHRRPLMKAMGNTVSGKEFVSSRYLYAIKQRDFGAQLLYPQSSFQIIEPSADEYYPGFAIRDGIADQDLTEWEDQAISSLELLFLTSDHWESAFGALTHALVDFLTMGRIKAAQELTRRVSPREVSVVISRSMFAKPIDIMAEAPTKLTHSFALSSGRSVEEVAAEARQQAIAYYELGQLLDLVVAVSSFGKQQVDKFRATAKSVAELEDSKTGDVGDPLWHVISLVRPFLLGRLGTEAVAAVETHYPALSQKLASIRATYLPQVVMASTVAVHTAAQLISSTYLSHILLFFTELGREVNHPLIGCFVQSDRLESLRVLITRCGLTLLRLNEVQARAGAPVSAAAAQSGPSRLDTARLWTMKKPA